MIWPTNSIRIIRRRERLVIDDGACCKTNGRKVRGLNARWLVRVCVCVAIPAAKRATMQAVTDGLWGKMRQNEAKFSVVGPASFGFGHPELKVLLPQLKMEINGRTLYAAVIVRIERIACMRK